MTKMNVSNIHSIFQCGSPLCIWKWRQQDPSLKEIYYMRLLGRWWRQYVNSYMFYVDVMQILMQKFYNSHYGITRCGQNQWFKPISERYENQYERWEKITIIHISRTHGIRNLSMQSFNCKLKFMVLLIEHVSHLNITEQSVWFILMISYALIMFYTFKS